MSLEHAGSLALLASEWAGSLLGLLGAFLLATNSRVSRYGWIAFLGANVAMIGFAAGIHAHGLLLQQLGFMATSCLGLYRTKLVPSLGIRRQLPGGREHREQRST